MLKQLIAAARERLHRFLRGSDDPNIRPEQAKESAGALGEVNHIANLR